MRENAATGLPYRFHHCSGLGRLRLHCRQACSCSRECRLVQEIQDYRRCQSVRAQVSRVMYLSFSTCMLVHPFLPIVLVILFLPWLTFVLLWLGVSRWVRWHGHCHGGHIAIAMVWGPLPPCLWASCHVLCVCLLDKCTIAVPVMDLSLGLFFLLLVIIKPSISWTTWHALWKRRR